MRSICTFIAVTILSSNIYSLELLNFKVSSVKAEEISFEWNSMNEANSDSYTLEMSQNAIEYIPFENVKSIGNSSSRHYKISTALSFSGTAYFRIKHIDYDGRITYSEVVSFSKDEPETEISIYPNPSPGETINLRINSSEKNSNQPIKLIGRTGRVIYESTLHSGIFDQQFNLEKGYYFVWITETNGNVITKKIVVN